MLEIQKLQAIALAGGSKKPEFSGGGNPHFGFASPVIALAMGIPEFVSMRTRSATASGRWKKTVLDSKTFRKRAGTCRPG